MVLTTSGIYFVKSHCLTNIQRTYLASRMILVETKQDVVASDLWTVKKLFDEALARIEIKFADFVFIQVCFYM